MSINKFGKFVSFDGTSPVSYSGGIVSIGPSLFAIGSRHRITLPEKYKDPRKNFENALIEVVSKKNYISKLGLAVTSVEKSKVVCRILETPNADANVKIIGLEYPIRRAWLNPVGHLCNCSIKEVLMITGCVCGGY